MKRLMELLNDDSNKQILESEPDEWEDDEDWDDEVGNDVAEFGYYVKYNDETVRDEIEDLAGELFTCNGGRPNYKTIKEFFKLSGYSVGPGESDSFGWLTGVIYKDDTMYICWG